jgi:iron complex outermembrane recepter protein
MSKLGATNVSCGHPLGALPVAKLGLLLVASVSIFALTGIAQAQDATATTTPATSTETVTVTGSRIVANGYEAPTPVTVVGAAEIQNQGITSLVDISRALPQFRSQGGSQSGSNGSANGGQGSLNLRNLGANRNLILLDGQRIVPSTGNGVVDTNILPSALIQRVDVVTGGASAAYGSDAVSGVVNFVINNKFDGLKGAVGGGISQQGDDIEYSADLAAGHSFLGGRLHVVGSGEYYQTQGQDLMNRSWLANRAGIINNPAYTKTNGQYQNLAVNGNIVSASMSTGGLVDGCRTSSGANIASCGLIGTAFGPDGSAHPFAYGTFVNPTGNMVVPIGSTNPDYTNTYDNIKMTNPAKRSNLYLRADYDLTDSLSLFADVIFARSIIGPSFTVPPYRFGTGATTWLSVTADNAYIPASVKAQMSGPGGGNPAGPYYLNVGRENADWGGNSKIQNTNTTSRFVGGFKDDIGDGWALNGYYEYGRNEYYGTVTNNLITSINGNTAAGNVNLAADAVAAPAGNAAGIAAGTIVCRSTLTNPSNGCAPLNIFGLGNASQAAIKYISGTQWTRQTYSQNYVEASITGQPISLWAGPVSIAAGLSYRSERIDAASDPMSQAGDFGIGNPQPYAGSYNVKELFAEISVPLLEGLTADLAGRGTQYSTSGQVETWKAGLNYNLPGFLSDLKLRATKSHDIRAPSLTELFTGYTQTRTSVTDPFKPGNSTFNAQQYSGGNINLKPEIADTVSTGFVYQPSWISGLSGSVDYYNIKIQNAIGTLTPQNIVNFCFQGQAALCSQIVRDANGNIISIYANNLNVAATETNGADIELNYSSELSDLISDWSGHIGARLFANYVGKFTTFNGVSTSEVVGCLTCQQPQWTAQALWTYGIGPYQATLINRFIGGGLYNNIYKSNDPSYVPNAIASNEVDPVLYTDINLQYDFEKFGLDMQAYININNLFDRNPPSGWGWGYGLSASPMYDVVGRMYKVGIRFSE